METKKIINVEKNNKEMKSKVECTAKYAYLFVGAVLASAISVVLYANSDTLAEQLISSGLIGVSGGIATMSFIKAAKNFKEDYVNNNRTIKDYIFEQDDAQKKQEGRVKTRVK